MIRKNLFLLTSVITVIVALGLSFMGVKCKQYKDYLGAGIEAMENKNYAMAAENLKKASNIYNKNKEVTSLKEAVLNYNKAKEQYDNEDYKSAQEYLNKIPNVYNNYDIKDDVDDLKNNIKIKYGELCEAKNK
ncbi:MULTISPECIES: hypothetical protein [Clostridium]|uniref:Lipoprotein n=1 Tax=Clostridium nitritogenes TaxID=83340 RepID=A0ABN1LN57_9CLOT|nr:hypothetical protein [Clostridium baratii]MBT9831963.1 hypothetical protein [Clostridium baratii]STA99869.1 Uncharacterised protein [Clostridium baratii]